MSRNGEARRIDVPTAGRPVEAVTNATFGIKGAAPMHVTVGHDDGCPCTDGQPLAECTCEIVYVTRTDLD